MLGLSALSVLVAMSGMMTGTAVPRRSLSSTFEGNHRPAFRKHRFRTGFAPTLHELPEGAIILKSKAKQPFLITVLDPKQDTMISRLSSSIACGMFTF